MREGLLGWAWCERVGFISRGRLGGVEAGWAGLMGIGGPLWNGKIFSSKMTSRDM